MAATGTLPATMPAQMCIRDSLGTAAAAALIAAAPMVIAYLFLQKYFIAGMIAGAEK